LLQAVTFSFTISILVQTPPVNFQCTKCNMISVEEYTYFLIF
jgi:hypothetical protein